MTEVTRLDDVVFCPFSCTSRGVCISIAYLKVLRAIGVPCRKNCASVLIPLFASRGQRPNVPVKFFSKTEIEIEIFSIFFKIRCFSYSVVRLSSQKFPSHVRRRKLFALGYGHTTLNTPVLVCSPKISNVGPGSVGWWATSSEYRVP